MSDDTQRQIDEIKADQRRLEDKIDKIEKVIAAHPKLLEIFTNQIDEIFRKLEAINENLQKAIRESTGKVNREDCDRLRERCNLPANNVAATDRDKHSDTSRALIVALEIAKLLAAGLIAAGSALLGSGWIGG